MKDLGARVYGLGAIHLGVLCLAWGNFAYIWIPPPATLPGRAAVADAVGAVLIAGGVLINWRPRFAAWGAGILTALFALGTIALDLTRLAVHLRTFDYWDASAEQVALVASGLIAYAMSAELRPDVSSRLQYGGRIVFGLCLFSFGAAHFAYLAHTVSMVPKWIPPGQTFWAYATAIAAIAAGLAFISGVLALLAARLLTLMYILFSLLVHAPILMANPGVEFNWSENAENLALVGAAWIIADSLAFFPRAASR